MTPPTTPPAIAPVTEPPLEEELDEGVDVDVDAWGVKVDWLALVEEGTIEAVPVISGESVIGPRIHKR